MYIALVIILMVFYIWFSVKKPGLALLTAPILCAVLINVFAACNRYSLPDPVVYAIFLTPLIFLATLLTIAISPHQGDCPPWPKRMARYILLLIILVPVAVFIIAISGPIGFYAAAFFIALFGSFIGFFLTQTRSVTIQVISTLGAAMRQNLPLPLALDSAAADRTDRPARVMRAISQSLTQGYPLSDALQRGFPACPAHVLTMIVAAEKISQLPQAFTDLEAYLMEQTFQKKQPRIIQPAYCFIVIFACLLMTAGLKTFIIPKFRDIFTDYGLTLDRLPWTSRLLMGRVTNFLKPAPLFLLPALLIFPIVWLKTRFRPRRVGEPYYLSQLGDRIKWRLPIYHWFELNHALTQLTAFLRTALQAGFTLDQSVGHALTLDVNLHFRNRLQNWLHQIRAGADPADSARRCHLGPTFAWAFEKPNAAATVDILNLLEGFFRTQYHYQAHLFKYIAGPLIIVALACLVGIIVHGTFTPLVAIIHQLADTVLP